MAQQIYARVDVTQLECHFKWFNELNNTFSGQWLSELLNKQLHDDLNSTIDASEVDNLVERDAVSVDVRCGSIRRI